MATTINTLSKPELESTIVSTANDIDRNILKWKRFASWYNGVTNEELGVLGLTNEDITNFRNALTAMGTLVTTYEGSCATAIQKFTKSVIF